MSRKSTATPPSKVIPPASDEVAEAVSIVVDPVERISLESFTREEMEKLVRDIVTTLQPSFAPRPQTLVLGRIVRYVLKDGPSVGQVRPALITRVWDETTPWPRTAQLTVFPDASNDFRLPVPNPVNLPEGTILTRVPGSETPAFLTVFGVSSAPLDQDGKAPGTFHFPDLG